MKHKLKSTVKIFNYSTRSTSEANNKAQKKKSNSLSKEGSSVSAWYYCSIVPWSTWPSGWSVGRRPALKGDSVTSSHSCMA